MPDTPEKLDLRSHDIAGDKLQELLRLFPEIRTEGGKIDLDKLKLALGQTVDTGRERYGMNWPGKADCFKTIQRPSLGTLRPCPEESINFDTTDNLIIEGDNLEVLKLLQKSYLGKVKMIYIDPPYNTGNDFIYPDNFSESLQTYLEYTGQVDAEGRKFGTNTETDGRFHSKWLNMMYPRLYLARNLLRDDGSIYISIDDNEAANLRKICDEIFGEENFKADISWQKRYTRSNNTVDFTTVIEHIYVYSRSPEYTVNLLPRTDDADARYTNPDNDPRGPWKGASFLNPATAEQRPNLCYPLRNPNTGEVTLPSKNAWRRSKEEFERLASEKLLYWGPDGKQSVPTIKMFLTETRGLTPINFWSYEYAGSTDDGTRDLEELLPGKIFNNPKPVSLLKRIIEHSCDNDSLVLDFFAGSGVTAQAIYEVNLEKGGNRKYILVQLPEPTDHKDYSTIAEVTKKRARRVIDKLNEEDVGKLKLDNACTQDRGFRVFKLTDSNFKAWNANVEPDAGKLAEQLALNVNNVRGERTADDILYELLLKSGFPLTSKIERLNLAGKPVYSVLDGAFLICLEPALTHDLIRAIADRKPQRVVCLDKGFEGNDQLKANAVQIFKTKGIESFRTV